MAMTWSEYYNSYNNDASDSRLSTENSSRVNCLRARIRNQVACLWPVYGLQSNHLLCVNKTYIFAPAHHTRTQCQEPFHSGFFLLCLNGMCDTRLLFVPSSRLTYLAWNSAKQKILLHTFRGLCAFFLRTYVFILFKWILFYFFLDSFAVNSMMFPEIWWYYFLHYLGFLLFFHAIWVLPVNKMMLHCGDLSMAIIMMQILTHGSVTYYLVLVGMLDYTECMRVIAGTAIDGNIDGLSKYWICILTLKYKNDNNHYIWRYTLWASFSITSTSVRPHDLFNRHIHFGRHIHPFISIRFLCVEGIWASGD